MLFITLLKLSGGPNYLYAFLRYFFDNVIRDSGIAHHGKWINYVEVSFTRYLFYRIFYFNIYGLEFHAVYNDTKIILETK